MAPNRITEPGRGYFVTLRINGWVDLFSRRKYADVVFDSLKYCIRQKGLYLYHYCLMTNHIHMIARCDSDLNTVLKDFKSYTGNEIVRQIYEQDESRREWLDLIFHYHGRRAGDRKLGIWNTSNYPVVLYSEHVIEQKINYVILNPVKAGFVSCPEHYLYSSAHPDHPMKGYLSEIE